MTSKNPHTGDSQKTKPPTDKYRDNYDLIFKKQKEKKDESTNRR